jgi:hypothetical protein
MRILRRPVVAGATLLLILLAVGCQQLLDLLISVPADASGTMVVSYGKYLYRIGGEAEGGAASDKTYVALIPDGSDAECLKVAGLLQDYEYPKEEVKAAISALPDFVRLR